MFKIYKLAPKEMAAQLLNSSFKLTPKEMAAQLSLLLMLTLIRILNSLQCNSFIKKKMFVAVFLG